MIELAPPRERALLVGAPLKSVPVDVVQEHMEELRRLTDTAGADVVGTLLQRLDSPHPRLYVGEGKAEELRELVKEHEATLVIFDEELSPAQGKNLEEFTGTRTMDRAELILDIFATRARSAEARIQVELAQLQYLLPRLTRMWAHLSRVRGGVGMRGPGETQLETDRRMIGHRIARLKEDLARVARQRATQRKGREEAFQAALVGYTNAGKSSVLRGLSGTDVFVEDRLFATLDAATRTVDLGEGYDALVTDTVGFIRKLPHHLVASFRATLEEAQEADLVLHVIDVSHSMWEEQKAVVDDVLRTLGLGDHPTALVFNKIDRLTHEEEQSWRERAASLYSQPAVFVSTVERDGLEPLRELLRDRIRSANPEVRIRVPSTDGGLIAEIYREGEVLDREDDGATVQLTARLPGALLGRLQRQPEVESAVEAEPPELPLHLWIIGPGRVGLALGLALHRAGALASLTVSGRRPAPPDHPLFRGSPAPARYRSGLAMPDPAPGVILLAVPDSAIGAVATSLAAQPLPPGVPVLHTSGALDAGVLGPLRARGCSPGSLHPLLAVSDPVDGADRMRGAWLALEGEPTAREAGARLAGALGARLLPIAPGAKPVYHAAAVFASNYLVVLLATAERLALDAGVPRDSARDALVGLARSALDGVADRGPASALTGPIARGDAETARIHLARLSPPDAALYSSLARATLEVARARGLDPPAVARIEQLLLEAE